MEEHSKILPTDSNTDLLRSAAKQRTKLSLGELACEFASQKDKIIRLTNKRRNNYYFVLFLFHLLIILPLSVVSIILPLTLASQCDNTDPIGLNVGQYLVISGIVSLTIYIPLTHHLFKMYKGLSKGISKSLTFAIIVYTLFGFCWIGIGGIVLFRSNLECIGSSHVSFALVLWCASSLNILYTAWRGTKITK